MRPKFVEREQGQGPDFRRRCLVERSGCEAAVHAVAQCVVVLLLLLLLAGKVEIERFLPFEAGGRARNAACALHSPRSHSARVPLKRPLWLALALSPGRK